MDLQYTSEREADQVWLVTPPVGDPFVLHCEFQTGNDKQMLPGMLLYHALLYYQQKQPVQQYVVYVGREPPQMTQQLQSGGLSFHYGLIDLKSFPTNPFWLRAAVRKCCLRSWVILGESPRRWLPKRLLLN